MRRFTVILLILSLMLTATVCNAETAKVPLKITTQNGEYYVSVNGEDARKCENGACYIEWEQESGNSNTVDLSDKNIKMLAQQLAGSSGSGGGASFDEVQLRAVLNDVSEKRQEGDREWITQTWMPQADKMQNMSITIEQQKGTISTLEARLQSTDAQISAKQQIVDAKTKENDELWILLIMVSVTLFLTWISKSEAILTIRDWWEYK